MRCTKKRILILIVSLVLLMAIVIGAVLFHISRDKTDKKNFLGRSLSKGRNDKSICVGNECITRKDRLAEATLFRKSCLTEDCIIEAAKMIRWMDKTVNPCDDFYNFSCGNFVRAHSLPDGWESFGTTDILSENIDLKIKSILEERILTNDSDSLRDTKKVYASCMNLSQIEATSSSDLRRVLSNAGGVGEWPLLNTHWKDCRLDLEWRLAKLSALGVDSLFRFETHFEGEDYRLQALLSVAEPLVSGICDEVYIETFDEVLQKASEHRKSLEVVLEVLGVNITNRTEMDMDDVFKFDFLFCNATEACQKKFKNAHHLSPNNKLTLLKLADMAPDINWIRWRNIVFSELRLNLPHDKPIIYADGLDNCIRGIGKLLRNTTSKVLANYLTWRFVFHHLGFLGRPFRQLLRNHPKRNNSLAMHSNRWILRWRQCVIYIKDLMPMAVLKAFYDKYYTRQMDGQMDDIVKRVKHEFRTIMKDSRDLLENDRIKSYQKIDKMQVKIAYPDREKKYFDKFYSGIGLLNGSFLENGMKLTTLRMQKLMEGIYSSRTVYDMGFAVLRLFSPLDLDARSFFRGNSILVTLGQLLSQGVQGTLPMYKKMSTFGTTVSHELSHGFDIQALQGGFASNWTWWSGYILKQAQKKAQCFLQFLPYTNYHTLKAEDMIQWKMLNEDLCDHQGIYIAFKAYINYLNRNGDEEILPGVYLSNEKLFFLSYAQQFCAVRGGRMTRVNQVLQNFPAFSEAFQCSTNKLMNSPKCRPLWQ